MTTLELFRKHRKGEVSRERFLYEVRRDSNLPWVTNTTSYDDAVKILKNKGIIREAEISELSPQTRYNATMASVDRLKNLSPDSLAYKKGISQASKFIHNIDPVIKKTVEDFAKKIGLNVSIKKEAEGSEYIPYILIKFYEKDSQNPEITVTLTKDSEKISGKLPNQEDERRLLNIIKQIQKKELDVKDTKSASQLKEAQFEPQNIATDPIVDRVNPYALKREVEKLLAKEKVLTNDSYKEALNKAAKKLTTPEAVKKAMFANAESVAKADANLQTQPVKKGNHVDKKNGMKKMKGQQMPKATIAPTKENKKTKKPKGVEIMPDKGVEGLSLIHI